MQPTRDALIPALILLVPAVLFLVVMQRPVEPWGDEAMLLANLLLPDLDLLAPLPFYEQASPPGYLWLARAKLELFGAEPPYHVLRFLSAAFMAVGVIVLILSEPLRSDRKATLFFVAFLLGAPMIWFYSGEIKHYSADFFASAMVLAFGMPLLNKDGWTRLGAFLLAVLVAGLVSFTVPIIATGLLVGIALLRMRPGASGAPVGISWPFVMTACLAMLYLCAMYLLLNRSLVSYQMSAYAGVYRPETDQGILRIFVVRARSVLDMIVNSLGPAWPDALRKQLNAWGMPIGLAYYVVRLAALMLLGVIAWLAARRIPAFVFLCLCIFSLVAALQMLGALNLPYSRHVIFLMPFSTILMASAAAAVVERYLPNGLGKMAMLATLLFCIAFGVKSGLGRQTQHVGSLLAHIEKTAPDIPVWVYPDSQPTFRVLSPRPANVLGEFDPSSGLVAWGVRGGEYLDPRETGGRQVPNPDYLAAVKSLAGQQEALWLIFSNEGVWNRRPFIEAVTAAVGPCNPVVETRAEGLYLCQR